MYDGVYFIFLKDGVKLLFVANVALIKLNLFSDYFLNALECLGACVVVVINTIGSYPALISSMQVWVPINPAPPVTNIAI